MTGVLLFGEVAPPKFLALGPLRAFICPMRIYFMGICGTAMGNAALLARAAGHEILGADTGVTKSDLAIWRDHLCGPALARYVALNKIDSLVDPLSSAAEVQQTIVRQCESVAQTLEIPANHVFPISARQALAARLSGDNAGLAQSRLEEFELALFMFRNTGRLLSRAHLLESVWSPDHTDAKDLPSRTLDTHISKLRSLLGLQPERGFKLVSVYRQGYRLEALNDALAA